MEQVAKKPSVIYSKIANLLVEKQIQILEAGSKRKKTIPAIPVATVSSYYSSCYVISTIAASDCDQNTAIQ